MVKKMVIGVAPSCLLSLQLADVAAASCLQAPCPLVAGHVWKGLTWDGLQH